MKTCSIGRERRKKKMLQNKQAMGVHIKFYIIGEILERVEVFRYQGNILRQDDDDTPTIISLIKKAR